MNISHSIRKILTLVSALIVSGSVVLAQTDITIGTATTTSANLPIVSNYGYTYSQGIYLASEYTAAGGTGLTQITKLRFYYNGNGASSTPGSAVTTTTFDDWTVYLGNTSQSTFSSTTNWIPTGSLTQVFSGTVTFPTPGNWMEITFSTPFIWDGTSNIVVAVDENRPNFGSLVYWRARTSGVTSRGIMYRSDSTNPNPASPPTATGVYSNLPNIQFVAQAATSCSGTPAAGTPPSNVTICPNTSTTLSVTGAESGSGISYQWQQWDGSVWVNAVGGSGATTVSYTTPNITSATQYRMRTTCSFSSQSATTGTVTVTPQMSVACYCVPTATTDDATGITNVTFNTINNSSVGTPAYTNFSGISTTVSQGAAYNLSVNVNTGGNYTVYVKAWVDWDQNGTFDASEIYNLGSAVNQTNGITNASPFSITVPSGATLGNTYMRVRAVYNTSTINACGNQNYSEAEDYTINVVAGVNCAGTPTAGTAPSGIGLCTGSSTTLSVTGAEIGTGISYQWEQWNGASWVNAVGGTGSTTTSFTTPALTTTTEYRLRVACSFSTQSTVTSGVTVTVNGPVNDVCASAQALAVGSAPVAGNISCASAGTGGCGGSTTNYDVWYSFNVTTPGDYKVILNSSTGFDGVFQLYNGCGGSPISSANNSTWASSSCIDGFYAGYPEFATYTLAAGTYHIRVYDFNDAGTAYPTTTDFTVQVVVPYNPCSAIGTIASCGSPVSTVLSAGTGEWSGFYDCSSFAYILEGKEAVYSFTPSTSGNYAVGVNSIVGGSYVNIMYRTTACGFSGAWTCLLDVNAPATSTNIAMTAGTTYYFLVKAELTSGLTVNWQVNCPPPPPVNDDCANATLLPCGTTALPGTTVASVPEPVAVNVASGLCAMGQYGVWYTFVGNGYPTTISSTATFDHEMGIARGSCGSLVNIACRDAVNGSGTETHTFNTVEGTTYYVYISHWSSTSTTTGTFTITRSCGVNEWTGNALNSDWVTNGNWSTGAAPTSTGTAYIPTNPAGANFPIIDEAAVIANLNIATGASVSVVSGHSMSVSGVLTNNGTFNVASGASLVQGTGSTLAGSGEYNVSRVGSSVYDFWSSPITDAPTSVLGNTVYAYNPQTSTASPLDDAFDPGWVAPGPMMIPAKGYAAYGNASGTFSGTVNNGNISASVQYFNNPNPALGGVPFNLIGNPYPSGISGAQFLSTNSGMLAVGSLYYWDDPGTSSYASSDFAVWNTLGGVAGGGNNTPGPIIGSAQGFEVKVNASGSIQFTNAMRVAGNTNMLFRTDGQVKKLWLSATSAENRINQTLVAFTDDGTDGQDWAYDAPKLNLLSGLSLYSLLNEEPFAIQGFGPLMPDRIVPLGLISGQATMVSIKLDTNDNMSNDIIYLEDRYLGVFQDLHNGPYQFQSDATTYSDRFFLHFDIPNVTAVREMPDNPMLAYIDQGILTVSKRAATTATLEMVDMSGRTVWKSAKVSFSDGRTQVDVSALPNGVYVLRMTAEGESSSKKLVK